jgi:UDP-N-acetylglucosamine:LPS N-acetylglucosamine transferase
MSKKILIAPLNWGLGHATRCMPLIDELLRQGADVMLASDGAALQLLREEYPQLPIFELPAYNIRYPFNSMMLSMVTQMPKILRGCLGEYFWLRKFIKTHKIDIVISDNRFGFFNKNTYNIFMTHQANILIPSKWMQRWVNRVNHFFIKKFHTLWIPDFENEPNLAGQLAHENLPKSLIIKYLGGLSRMKPPIETLKKYQVIAVLSGPEPQRTHLEKIILEQFEKMVPPPDTLGTSPYFDSKNLENKPFLLVRGVMNDTIFNLKNKKIEIHNYLKAKELQEKINQSNVMICRSGYSTIMDLVTLKIPAILIPTPGQTEQEYLASELMRKNLFYTQNQDKLDLEVALENVKNYEGFGKFQNQQETLSQIVNDLLKF